MNKYLVRPWFIQRRKKYFPKFLEECRAKNVQPGLHIGCGDRPIPGWFNGDVARLGGLVHYVNGVRNLPFPNESFQYVFSEHFIEHLNYAQGNQFFKEAYRVLKKGGVLRTATPNLQLLRQLLEHQAQSRTQAQPQKGAYDRYVEWTSQTFLPHQPQSPVTAINLLFYGWGHRFIYDPDFMIEVLKRVGFKNFKALKSGESDHVDLRNLEQHGKSVPPEINELETMVIEATK